MILGTWHVVKWEDPVSDSFFTMTQRYIDTIGKGHNEATNIAIYEVANMDSMRDLLQKQHDSAKAAKENSIAKTTFTFAANGAVVVTMNGISDTGKWLIDNENALLIEEQGFGNPQGVSKYRVVDLSDKQLVLRFYDENDSNTVTFEHEGK